MTIQTQPVAAKIKASFNSGIALGAARQKWASDAADAAVEAEREDGARVSGRDDDSGYSYHTALGDRIWDAAFDEAAKDWDRCEAEFRRLMMQFNPEIYCTPAEHAFNEIGAGYGELLVEAIFEVLEVV